MNDVQFEPRDLRLALIEASEGAIGSPMEKFALFMCYRYDPDANSYVASARKVMRLGGLVTVIAVGAPVSRAVPAGPSVRDTTPMRQVTEHDDADVAITLATGMRPGLRGPTFWMPEQASTVAGTSTGSSTSSTWICYFFFVLIVRVMVYFMWKYRRRPGVEAEQTATHNTPLELTWTIIPLILVIAIFYVGMKGYINLRLAPQGAVRGRRHRRRSGSGRSSTATARSEPASCTCRSGTPVKLNMTSQDVLHSLFIPAFRVKQDVVPGRVTTLWFEATGGWASTTSTAPSTAAAATRR